MENPLISIVLPIYNVEPYLNRCMDSVTKQTYTNLEIIMVDDGSPDGCPALCDAWAEKDPRVKVVHKQNAGLGMARNSGLEVATGDYIFFIDSDDYINTRLVELCVQQAEETGAEIVHYGVQVVDAAGTVKKTLITSSEQLFFEGDNVKRVFFPNVIGPAPYPASPYGFSSSAWSSMYSMDLIRRADWRFVSEREIISEDIYSHLSLYPHVNSVAVIPKPLYRYCENPTSLTHTYRKDRYARIRHFYLESVALCERLNLGQEVISRLSNPYFANTVSAMKQIALADIPKKERLSLMREIVEDDTLQQVLKGWCPGGASWKIRKFLIPLMRKKQVRLCLSLSKMQAKK